MEGNSFEKWPLAQHEITYIVSLFESTVLLDKVKIITSDDDGTLHLLLTDNTGQNSATKNCYEYRYGAK